MLVTATTLQAWILFGLQSFVLTNPLPSNDLDSNNNNNVLDVDLSLGITLLTGEPEVLNGLDERAAFEAEAEDAGIFRRQSGDAAEALRLHNVKRAGKKLPALTWDSTLASNAKAWADKLAKQDRMEHSSGSSRPNQGENLAYAWSSGTISNPMTQGTTAWLAEEKNYKNEVIPQGNFASYGHYTQCMWRNTQRVGIATASNGKGAWYTVARYSPQGNIGGQRPY